MGELDNQLVSRKGFTAMPYTLFITSIEIAEAYVLLAGPGGNYMTGSVIHVNGGMHMGG